MLLPDSYIKYKYLWELLLVSLCHWVNKVYLFQNLSHSNNKRATIVHLNTSFGMKHMLIMICLKKKYGGGCWVLGTCLLSSFVEFHSTVLEKKLKMSRSIRGQGGNLGFPFGPKNTNILKGVEIFLPFKFHWIPFGGFREEVENVSVNQRSGGHLGLKKTQT